MWCFDSKRSAFLTLGVILAPPDRCLLSQISRLALERCALRRLCQVGEGARAIFQSQVEQHPPEEAQAPGVRLRYFQQAAAPSNGKERTSDKRVSWGLRAILAGEVFSGPYNTYIYIWKKAWAPLYRSSQCTRHLSFGWSASISPRLASVADQPGMSSHLQHPLNSKTLAIPEGHRKSLWSMSRHTIYISVVEKPKKC